MVDYERLDVYRCAIERLRFVFKALPLREGSPPSLISGVALQPRSGSRPDRMNKFAIARGEAMECGAILDVVTCSRCYQPRMALGLNRWSFERSRC
jgi:hypothetical protein